MTKNLNRALAIVTNEPASLAEQLASIGHNSNAANSAEPAPSKERTDAFDKVQGLAMAEGTSRRNLVTSLMIALGGTPSKGEIDACRKAYMIGRIAGRLASDAFPAGCSTPAKRLAYAAKVYADKAARTGDAEKAYNAAKSAWSPLLSECGHGKAESIKDKNAKAKRPARPEGNAKGKTDVTPQATETPKTPADVMAFITGQANIMAMYCKKHAKLVPTSVGEAVNALARIAAGQTAQ